MNTAEKLAIVGIIISLSSTILVFFERAAFNRRIRAIEEKFAALGNSLFR